MCSAGAPGVGAHGDAPACASIQSRTGATERVAMARGEESFVSDAPAAGVRGRIPARLARAFGKNSFELARRSARGDGIVGEADASAAARGCRRTRCPIDRWRGPVRSGRAAGTSGAILQYTPRGSGRPAQPPPRRNVTFDREHDADRAPARTTRRGNGTARVPSASIRRTSRSGRGRAPARDSSATPGTGRRCCGPA